MLQALPLLSGTKIALVTYTRRKEDLKLGWKVFKLEAKLRTDLEEVMYHEELM